jgi:hypothetical protein
MNRRKKTSFLDGLAKGVPHCGQAFKPEPTFSPHAAQVVRTISWIGHSNGGGAPEDIR